MLTNCKNQNGLPSGFILQNPESLQEISATTLKDQPTNIIYEDRIFVMIKISSF